MSDRVFVDTNVLIYARDPRHPDKKARAAAWLLGLGTDDRACINLQILNEMTRWLLKSHPNLSLSDIQDEIEILRFWGDAPVTGEELEVAWAVRERLGYPWFDCLLIASAHKSGCRYFLTEDMTHGASFEDLTLINPFRAAFADVFQRT